MTKLIAAIAAALFVILTTSLTAGAQAPAPKPAEKPAKQAEICNVDMTYTMTLRVKNPATYAYSHWVNYHKDDKKISLDCFLDAVAKRSNVENSKRGWATLRMNQELRVPLTADVYALVKGKDTEIKKLGGKVLSLENDVLRLTAQNAKLAGAVDYLQEELAGSARIINELSAAKNEQIADLEQKLTATEGDLNKAADVIEEQTAKIVGLEQKLAATATQGAAWKAQVEQDIIRLTEERDGLQGQTVRLAVELADAKHALKEEQKLREFSSAVNEVGKLARSVTGFASELRALSEKIYQPPQLAPTNN